VNRSVLRKTVRKWGKINGGGGKSREIKRKKTIILVSIKVQNGKERSPKERTTTFYTKRMKVNEKRRIKKHGKSQRLRVEQERGGSKKARKKRDGPQKRKKWEATLEHSGRKKHTKVGQDEAKTL